MTSSSPFDLSLSTLLIMLLCGLFMSLPPLVLAEDQDAASPHDTVEKESPVPPPDTSDESIAGRAIILRTADFYAGLPSMSATMAIRLELPEDFPIPNALKEMSYEMFIKRPSSVTFRPKEDPSLPAFVQDGTQQYMDFPPFSRYTLGDSTASTAELVNAPEEKMIMIPGGHYALSFGLPETEAGALRSVRRVRLIGEMEMEGIPCHHLEIEDNSLDGEIWVARGENPWVVRFYPTVPEQEIPEPDEDSGGMTFSPRLDIRYSKWDESPDLDGAFEIKPRDNFRKVERLMPSPEEMAAGPGGSGGAPQGMPEEHPSVGKPAPSVKIQPLEGEAFELSSLKGKVVVLDFWATWCRPCVMSMPHLAAVAREFADRNVVIYAVNQREPIEKVTPFLKSKKLDLPAALDRDGSVGAAFGVRGIPHLVVIDQKGTVHTVRIGYSPDGAESLKKILEELLAQ